MFSACVKAEHYNLRHGASCAGREEGQSGDPTTSPRGVGTSWMGDFPMPLFVHRNLRCVGGNMVLLIEILVMVACLMSCAYYEVEARKSPSLLNANGVCVSSPPLFVFGASMVDVGENSVAMPYRSSSDFPPYGMDYFHRPAGRFSNGRLFIDFISQRMGYGLLDPYLKSVGANFTYGVSFASSGSTARNTGVSAGGNESSALFSLMVQVDQFREFKESVAATESRNNGHSKALPSVRAFSDAIYFIEIGHNDYENVDMGKPIVSYLPTVGAVIASMENALRALYNMGARNIITMNLMPLGCIPASLAFNSTAVLDAYGCRADYNNLADLHNKHLERLLNRLRVELPLANWILFDFHAQMLDAFQNPSKYGVKYPFKVCCGAGGKYNFVLSILCGQSGYIDGKLVEAKRCQDPSLHIIWDTIHPVESLSSYIAQGVLSGAYLKPKFDIKNTCNPLVGTW